MCDVSFFVLVSGNLALFVVIQDIGCKFFWKGKPEDEYG
jgi:hypothetical protein